MYQALIAYATWITALMASLVCLANIYYVAKFKESVDIQRKTSQGSLIMSISNQFFYTSPHKEMIRRLDDGKSLRGQDGGFSDSDLDDHIGMLDSIGTFVKAGILDEHLVWAFFFHYVQQAHDSSEIMKYVNAARKIDPSYFEDFIWIHGKLENRKAGKA